MSTSARTASLPRVGGDVRVVAHRAEDEAWAHQHEHRAQEPLALLGDGRLGALRVHGLRSQTVTPPPEAPRHHRLGRAQDTVRLRPRVEVVRRQPSADLEAGLCAERERLVNGVLAEVARMERVLAQLLEGVAPRKQTQAVADPGRVRRLQHEPADGPKRRAEKAQDVQRRDAEMLDHLGADHDVVVGHLRPEVALLRRVEVERDVPLALARREAVVAEAERVHDRARQLAQFHRLVGLADVEDPWLLGRQLPHLREQHLVARRVHTHVRIVRQRPARAIAARGAGTRR